jgi:hypothetical protein
VVPVMDTDGISIAVAQRREELRLNFERSYGSTGYVLWSCQMLGRAVFKVTGLQSCGT